MSTLVVSPGFGAASARRPARRTTAAPAVAPTGAPAVHLTRRGRWVVTLLLLGLVLAVLTVFGAHSAATGEAGSPVKTRMVEVGEGDTLWQIASYAAAPGKVREMIHQIEELNALSGSAIIEGQEIAVPVH